MYRFTKIILGLAIASFTLFAYAEPTNLSVYKNGLKQYVSSGEYLAEQQAVAKQAQTYLEQAIIANNKLAKPKQLAIVLDIDETSLSNYPSLSRLDFGGSTKEINQAVAKGNDPVITPTLELYNFAKSHGVAVFFVTGRPWSMMKSTISNLKHAGYYNWNGIILRTKDNMNLPASQYKPAVRRKITNQGYTIVVNMGDQQSDLSGGYAEKGFKLPNPFYYLP